MDPALWSGLPHKNPTAWRDFTGTLALYHRALAQAIHQLTGVSIRVLPLGDGDGSGSWLEAVQSQYNEAARALGIAAPVDVRSYDLAEADQFASWTFLVSTETRRLRNAAGLS